MLHVSELIARVTTRCKHLEQTSGGGGGGWMRLVRRHGSSWIASLIMTDASLLDSAAQKRGIAT